MEQEGAYEFPCSAVRQGRSVSNATYLEMANLECKSTPQGNSDNSSPVTCYSNVDPEAPNPEPCDEYEEVIPRNTKRKNSPKNDD